MQKPITEEDRRKYNRNEKRNLCETNIYEFNSHFLTSVYVSILRSVAETNSHPSMEVSKLDDIIIIKNGVDCINIMVYQYLYQYLHIKATLIPIFLSIAFFTFVNN